MFARTAIGHVAGIGQGGGAAAIGDIIFATAKPSDDYIALDTGRVYVDQFPDLSSIFQVRTENDGGDWQAYAPLNPVLTNLGATTGHNISYTTYALAAGVVGSENILVIGGDYGIYVLAGDAGGYTFDTYRELLSAPKNGGGDRYYWASADFSPDGTIMLAVFGSFAGTNSCKIFRSTNGGRSWTIYTPTQLGMSNNLQHVVARWVKDKEWWFYDYIQYNLNISKDDGLSFSLRYGGMTAPRSDGGSFGLQPINIVIGETAVALVGRSYKINGYRFQFLTLLRKSDAALIGRYDVPEYGASSDVQVLTAGIDGSDLVVGMNDLGSGSERIILVRFSGFAGVGGTTEDMVGTEGWANQPAVIDSFDGFSYLQIPGIGLYQKTGSTFLSERLVSPASGPVASFPGGAANTNWGRPGILRFAKFAMLADNAGYNLSDFNQRLLLARPSAQARKYILISSPGAIGAPRTDGKLPFMRAR